MPRSVLPVLFAILAGAAAPGEAGEFKVGPAATYPTIQEALTAAALAPLVSTDLRNPDVHHVLVQRGTYLENLRAPNPCCGNRIIRVQGGWDSAFVRRVVDPAKTIVDGRDRGRVLTVPNVSGGTLIIESLTF